MAEETELAYDGYGATIQEAADKAAAKILADANIPPGMELRATIWIKKPGEALSVHDYYSVLFTPQ